MTRGALSCPGRLRRLVSALLGAFLLSMGAAQDGYGLHPCVHHDAPAGEAAAHAHGEHASETGAPVDEPCTCVATCHAAGDLPAAPVPHDSAIPVPAAVRQQARRPDRTALPAAAEFLLPYPTAPPVL